MKKILFIVICLLMITGCNDQELNENNSPDDTLILELIKTTGCINQSFDASIEQLINQMEMVSAYKDGGTVLYQKDDYRMLVCNTLDGNKDVYFGDITLEYENDYCVYK